MLEKRNASVGNEMCKNVPAMLRDPRALKRRAAVEDMGALASRQSLVEKQTCTKRTSSKQFNSPERLRVFELKKKR